MMFSSASLLLSASRAMLVLLYGSVRLALCEAMPYVTIFLKPCSAAGFLLTSHAASDRMLLHDGYLVLLLAVPIAFVLVLWVLDTPC